MQKLVDFYKLLDGKKTYIVAFVIATLNITAAFGLLSAEAIETINFVLVALGLGAIRAGVAKK